MAKDRATQIDYASPLRRLFVAILVIVFFVIFLIWRIDSPRVERFRAEVIDKTIPSFAWASAPITGMARIAADFRSYQRIYDQNQELKRELQQMKAWKEAALQLEQENARLLDLNKVRLDPKFTYITGVVLADSGSPFRQSVLLNVGARDGVQDGWATMDGIGLVGRISGVGQETSRVVLLTDTSSRVPIVIQPSGQRAILAGSNTARPLIELLDDPDSVRPGDRVFSSGEGAVFPPGILVGEVTQSTDRRLRVRLTADYERLEFLRVIRARQIESITDPGSLVTPADSSAALLQEQPDG